MVNRWVQNVLSQSFKSQTFTYTTEARHMEHKSTPHTDAQYQRHATIEKGASIHFYRTRKKKHSIQTHRLRTQSKTFQHAPANMTSYIEITDDSLNDILQDLNSSFAQTPEGQYLIVEVVTHLRHHSTGIFQKLFSSILKILPENDTLYCGEDHISLPHPSDNCKTLVDDLIFWLENTSCHSTISGNNAIIQTARILRDEPTSQFSDLAVCMLEFISSHPLFELEEEEVGPEDKSDDASINSDATDSDTWSIECHDGREEEDYGALEGPTYAELLTQLNKTKEALNWEKRERERDACDAELCERALRDDLEDEMKDLKFQLCGGLC